MAAVSLVIRASEPPGPDRVNIRLDFPLSNHPSTFLFSWFVVPLSPGIPQTAFLRAWDQAERGKSRNYELKLISFTLIQGNSLCQCSFLSWYKLVIVVSQCQVNQNKTSTPIRHIQDYSGKLFPIIFQNDRPCFKGLSLNIKSFFSRMFQ